MNSIDIKKKENIIKHTEKQKILLDKKDIGKDIYLLSSFEDYLLNILKKQKLSNIDLIKISAINGILPEETKIILEKHKEKLEKEYIRKKRKKDKLVYDSDKNKLWNYLSDDDWNRLKYYIKYKD